MRRLDDSELDAVADELYGLPPGDFTATRNERARAARASGDRELAEAIRRLRRPTLTAWASNLLVRGRPEEVRRLLELGEALRQAHRDLDGEQLRALSAQQHQVTFALAQQAGRLTAEAGQRLGDEAQREVQETLHAVLADPDAARQWAQGRLTKPLSAPVGFPVPSRAPAAARRDTAPSGHPTELEAARSRRQEQQERLERARQEASDAEGVLQERQEALRGVQEELDRAEDRRQRAEQRIGELARQMEEAEDEQRLARDEAGSARDRARAAERAVDEARRQAEAATAHALKLAEQLRGKTRRT